MINIQDLMNQQNSFDIPVSLEKINLFIDRVIKEKGYTLAILGQEIQHGLQRDGMHNLVEDCVYQKILQQVIIRYKEEQNR